MNPWPRLSSNLKVPCMYSRSIGATKKRVSPSFTIHEDDGNTRNHHVNHVVLFHLYRLHYDVEKSDVTFLSDRFSHYIRVFFFKNDERDTEQVFLHASLSETVCVGQIMDMATASPPLA